MYTLPQGDCVEGPARLDECLEVFGSDECHLHRIVHLFDSIVLSIDSIYLLLYCH